MPEDTHRDEMNKAMFFSLIMMFQSSAMQQLGKLVNPATGKTESDLPGAQMAIDMLMMLQEKTRGNLDAREAKLLSDTISALQMNYVETANSPAAKEAPKAETADSAGTPPAAEAPPTEDKKPDPKDPKFRKSYG